MISETLKDTITLFICIMIIFFLYNFVYLAHFDGTPRKSGFDNTAFDIDGTMMPSGSVACQQGSCGMAHIAKERSRVQYQLSGDFYPNSVGFPRPVRQWREWIRRYRADNLRTEFGNYGPFDIEGYRNRLRGSGDAYPDPVGSQERH